MKNWFRYLPGVFAFLLISIGIVQAASAQDQSTWQRVTQTKTLRLGAGNSSLWAFKDTRNSDAPGGVKINGVVWRGLGPVVAQALADALGAKLEIVETTWGNAVAGLQANQFDMIFGLDPTPQRATTVGFVPQPLFWFGTALVAHPGVDISSWVAINQEKLKVGVPAGTSMQFELSKRAPDAALSLFQDYDGMIAAFQTGRIDALASVLTTGTIISGRLKGTVVKMPEPVALYPASAAIRQETDPRWQNFLVTSLQYLTTNGFVQNAMNDVYRYWGVDITKVQPVVTR